MEEYENLMFDFFFGCFLFMFGIFGIICFFHNIIFCSFYDIILDKTFLLYLSFISFFGIFFGLLLFLHCIYRLIKRVKEDKNEDT